MNRMLAAIAVLVLTTVGAVAEQAYTMNPGDMLHVSVWKEEGLDRQVLVLPDGNIQFPLAGELPAVGRTVEQVQEDITERLKKYIPDAVVTVSVVAPAGNKVYVVGEVRSPGEIPLTRQLNIMQALSLAGGLSPYGSEGKILILRQSAEGGKAIEFSYADVKAGRDLESNVTLQSGDVIVVRGATLF